MQKWNFSTKLYEPYNIPDDWHSPIIAFDMAEEVNCTNCGKRLPFGDCFTSRAIHTHIGLGYPVCGECYDTEGKGGA